MIVGLTFCTIYLSMVGYLSPYKDPLDNFFSTFCQVQMLLVMLSSMAEKSRKELDASADMIDKLDGPLIDTVKDEKWYDAGLSASVHLCACFPR